MGDETQRPCTHVLLQTRNRMGQALERVVGLLFLFAREPKDVADLCIVIFLGHHLLMPAASERKAREEMV